MTKHSQINPRPLLNQLPVNSPQIAQLTLRIEFFQDANATDNSETFGPGVTPGFPLIDQNNVGG